MVGSPPTNPLSDKYMRQSKVGSCKFPQGSAVNIKNMFETTGPCRTHGVGAVTLPRKTWTKTQGMSLQIWMYRLYRKDTGSLQDCERQNVGASCLESIPGVVVVCCPPATKNRRSIPLVSTYIVSIKMARCLRKDTWNLQFYIVTYRTRQQSRDKLVISGPR